MKLSLSSLLPLLPLSASRSSPRPPVNLEVHIMSKCPDAQYAFQQLVAPSLTELASRVDPPLNYTLSFIGHATGAEISCKHGPEECLGNMLHLCGDSLASSLSQSISWSSCLLQDYEEIPARALVERCAQEAGVGFDAVNDCISDIGERGGAAMLRRSVLWSEHVGARISATVRVAGKVVCIRDDGEWKECEGGHEVRDLVREVEEAYYDGGAGGLYLEGVFWKGVTLAER
jgi:hypothetical protein